MTTTLLSGPPHAALRDRVTPFCASGCCQNDSTVSQSFDATAMRWPSSSPLWAAALHLSGPPRIGGTNTLPSWVTPDRKHALARSLPIESCSKRASSGSPATCKPWCPTFSSLSASNAVSSSVAVEQALAQQARVESPAVAQAEVVRSACRLLDRVVGECQLSRVHTDLSPDQVFAPIFHSVSVPSISGGNYLVHHLLRLGLAKKEHLYEAVVLHALLLIDRLLQREAPRGFHLCTRNVHRVLLATSLVSAKLLDDECYNNNYWASVGGVSLSHLNQLEVEVMSLLDFQLLVTASMIDAARARLLSSVGAAA